jgi:hypothetical protein
VYNNEALRPRQRVSRPSRPENHFMQNAGTVPGYFLLTNFSISNVSNRASPSLTIKRQFQLLRRFGIEPKLFSEQGEKLVGSQRMQVVGLLQLANPDR